MIPVILSGGSGTRLWPVSRQSFPKQFCEFLDESLFAKTVKRVLPLGSPWVVTVRELKVLTERSLREFGISPEQALYEPKARNTAPAVALLCKVLESRGLAQETVGVFPADHLIENEEAFLGAVERANAYAREGHIVTLGVQPTYPATGYGYIETSGAVAGSNGEALRAVRFREKPDEETAKRFLEQGGFYWNAGMFIFKVSCMIEHLANLAPDVWGAFTELRDDLSNLDSVYEKARSISIDYAVMEKLEQHVCIPCTCDWSDLGSWDAVAGVFDKANKASAKTISVASKNNFVLPAGYKTYAFVDVDDLLVIDAADAVLIARRGSSERVRDVVDQLKKTAEAQVLQHVFEVRPWGRFEVLRDTDHFKSKTIVVDAGAQLSYQSHSKRAEHWIIVRGKGEVVLDDETIPVESGSHVYIPIDAKHRIRNTGTEPLEFVEVQIGTYFGEDDIVRYDDIYGRTGKA